MNLRQTIDHKIKTFFLYEEIFLYKNNFISKKFYNSNSMICFKNFDNSVYLFVDACVYGYLWVCVYMAVCVCVRSECQCANCFKKIHHIQYANWYLAFQNVTKFDSTVSKLDWVKKIYENYCDIWIDENKGARYKGNIFSGTRFQCRTVLFRNQSTKSDSTFQSYDGKKILLGCDCCFDWASHSLSYDKKFQQILKKNEMFFFETTQFSTCNPWNGEKKNYISSELSVQILTSN